MFISLAQRFNAPLCPSASVCLLLSFFLFVSFSPFFCFISVSPSSLFFSSLLCFSPLLSLSPLPLFTLPLSPSPFFPSFSFLPNLSLYTRPNDCASEYAFEIVGTDASNDNASSGVAFVCSAAYFGTASTLTTRADGNGLFPQSDYLGSYCSDVVRRVGDEAK